MMCGLNGDPFSNVTESPKYTQHGIEEEDNVADNVKQLYRNSPRWNKIKEKCPHRNAFYIFIRKTRAEFTRKIKRRKFFFSSFPFTEVGYLKFTSISPKKIVDNLFGFLTDTTELMIMLFLSFS